MQSEQIIIYQVIYKQKKLNSTDENIGLSLGDQDSFYIQNNSDQVVWHP
jgi:hypothetical protein